MEGGYTVTFPDLPGCITEGDNLKHATEMAIDAMSGWILVSQEDKDKIPEPSEPDNIKLNNDEILVYIPTNIIDYKKKINKKAVKKTLTIPGWLNKEAEEAHINFSSVLKEALINKLNL
jgi:antitoxin HicB